ncbi:MAG: S8 family serine peptidase [Acidobacteria bacterium]|nr:S8 family serine peptidase [Acidobacteriota bacterium]
MRLGLLSTLTAALCCSSLGSAQNLSRVHPALLAGTQTDSQRVIVLYKSEAAPDAGTRIAHRHNVKLQSHFRSTGISTFRLTRKEIRELADDPEIAYIAPDRTVRAASLDRGAEAVGAYQAQSYGFTGAGVGVAFIDSGVSYHTCDWNDNCQAPNTRYLAQVSFVTDLNGSWTAPDDGQDYYGHGTHVASIAGGAGTFSTAYVNQWNIYPNYWIRGVAPGINIVSLRVLDRRRRPRQLRHRRPRLGHRE